MNPLKRHVNDECQQVELQNASKKQKLPDMDDPTIFPFTNFVFYDNIFQYFPVYGDGHCFFRSFLLAYLENNPTNIHVFNLRRLLANNLLKNFNRYHHYFDENVDLVKYSHQLKTKENLKHEF